MKAFLKHLQQKVKCIFFLTENLEKGGKDLYILIFFLFLGSENDIQIVEEIQRVRSLKDMLKVNPVDAEEVAQEL